MKQRTRRLPRPRAITAIAACGLAASMVSGAAGAVDLFTSPWLGFNAGSSAYPGNPQPFERDPTALATADFNGDGYVDVAVANYEYSAPGGGTDGMSGFAVLFGGPGRRFSEPTHVTVSNRGCWDIVAADFNNDDHPDVAVSISDAFWEGTTVRVYLNDGSGAFPVAHTRSVLDGPIGLAAADFDADGNMDLAVASYRSFEDNGAVSILRGDGTGSLLAATPYLVGRRPWKLEAGDLDGDGDIDLAVAHEWHEVTVMENAGDGTFPSFDSHSGFFPLQGGQFYACIALADNDRDNDPDIFYSNTRSGQPAGQQYIVHLRNDGGAFTRAGDIPADAMVDLVSDDLDGDGWPDLVGVVHSARDGDGPRIVMNNGSGGFLPLSMVAAGQGTFAVTFADVDSDGDPDLLSADRYSMAVTVHENPGDGAFPVPGRFETAGMNIRMDVGDVDNDGDLDVFTGTEPTGFPGALLRNNGDGSFEPPVIYSHSTTYGRGVSRPKLRDLDGDGDLDLLYNGAHTDFHEGYNFYTAMNDGAGNFGPITQWVINTCGNGDVDAFDLDGDGDLDVVNCEELACGGGGGNHLFISLNNGDGTFAAAYTVQISTGPHALIGGDFNHDGLVDLVTTHWMPYGARDFINVHLGNGDGAFQEEVVYQVGQGPRWITQDDFNGDGHTDLATGNSGSDNEGRETMTVLFGTGTGTFTGRVDYYLPFSPDLIGATGLTSGDIDLDGDVDIMAVTVANGMAVYESDGTGGFSFRIRYGLSWDPWNLVHADFDGDGVKDVGALTSDVYGLGLSAALTILPGTEAGGSLIFQDGFGSGDTSAWSATVP